MLEEQTGLRNSNFETSDVEVGRVISVGVVIVVIIMTTFLIAKGWFLILERHPKSVATVERITELSKKIPDPKLQIDSNSDLEKYLAAQTKLLGSYGWIDKERKIIRVPIERAMDEYVRQNHRSGGQK